MVLAPLVVILSLAFPSDVPSSACWLLFLEGSSLVGGKIVITATPGFTISYQGYRGGEENATPYMVSKSCAIHPGWTPWCTCPLLFLFLVF